MRRLTAWLVIISAVVSCAGLSSESTAPPASGQQAGPSAPSPAGTRPAVPTDVHASPRRSPTNTLDPKSTPAFQQPTPFTLPTDGPCPPLPTTIEQLLEVADGTGARCYGNQTINVTAWYTLVEGDCGTPAHWLLQRHCGHVIGLGQSLTGMWVYLHPELRWPRRDMATYRFTGHFDDPAALDCPIAGVDGCRARFVVTHFKPAQRAYVAGSVISGIPS